MISPAHVITASHVVAQARKKHSLLTASVGTTLFDCDVKFDSPEHDLCVLQIASTVAPGDQPPQQHPATYALNPSHGMSVGFMGRLHRKDRSGEDRAYTAFFPASLSFFLRGPDSGTLWALSGGFAEAGFSGGPVFDRDGALVGVVVQTLQFAAGGENAVPYVVNLPVMSAIAPVLTQVTRAIQ
jgi:hypothetical protein